MSNDLLVQCCAPTLAGLKTGSLFSCPCPDRKELTAQIRQLNRQLRERGLMILPLRYSQKRALVYLFRPLALQRDLKNSTARAILDGAGYGGLSSDQCLLRLIRRLRESGDFPHEIGLFLSYPPEDVRGFIENHAENFKCVGVWKVYGDAEKAQKIFEKYKKCTDFYSRCIHSGIGISALAVNTGKG